MKQLIALGAFALAVSCGAQSEPLKPTGSVGVSVGTNGVNTTTNLGLSNGNVSIGVSL